MAKDEAVIAVIEARILHAVAAERERCAKVADGFAERAMEAQPLVPEVVGVAQQIAVAIRNSNE